MKFFLAGEWQSRSDHIEVVNPFDQSVVDTVPRATVEDVEAALVTAVGGAATMEAMSGYDRSLILRRASELILERQEDLAQTISAEEGKTLREARTEVLRSAQTMELSAEEARRINGEVLPLDGSPGTAGKLGLTLRVPCGVVVAITPFNFPLNLVCHKVGPALAAGNAVILKPASDTPLSALKLVKILLEAGLPPVGISCITGHGSTIGNMLCRDHRVRKISFTGSHDVGEQICRVAGMKRVTMELGSNSPLIVLPDADLNKVRKVVVGNGFANAGQVCISAQRLIVTDDIHDELVRQVATDVGAITTGDQLHEKTQMGPMVRASDAERVHHWITEAIEQGAKLECGGGLQGATCEPTLLSGATEEMKVVRDEVFGPTVAVQRVSGVEHAIRVANDTPFGLSAGVFTQDIDSALRFARQVHSGNVHINWGPMWRADSMPYGGMKNSGIGREGPRYAIEEMTELKTVVIHSDAN